MTQASSVAKKPSSYSFARWIARVPLEARLVILLCVLALALRLLPLGGIETDYDEGVYWQSLLAMSHGQSLFTGIFSSQPPFFLLSIYPLYRLFALFLGENLEAARLAIAVYSLMGLVAIYAAARIIGGRLVGLLALALLVVDPFYLKESYTLQAEVPSLAWELLALALVVAAVHGTNRSAAGRRGLLLLLSGVAVGLGVLVKLFDVFVLVPIVLYLLAPVAAVWQIQERRLRFQGWKSLRLALSPFIADLALVGCGIVVALLVVLLPFAASWGTLFDQVIRYHLSAGQYVARSLGYNIKLLLAATTEYPLVILALISTLAAVNRRSWIIVPPLIWFLVCLAFLLKQQPLFGHDLILLVPPLVLLASLIMYQFQAVSFALPSISNPAEWVPEHIYAALIAGVLLLGLLIGGVIAHRNAVSPLPEASVAMASALRAATLPSDLVASDDQYIAGLANRDVPPQLVDTSQVRIESRYLTASQVESIISKDDIQVILFASGRFAIIPGFSSWVHANFTEIQAFGNGNALYMKEPHDPITAHSSRPGALITVSSRPGR